MSRLKLCSYPGCRAVVSGQARCETHSRGPAVAKKVRDPFLDSQAWRVLSALVARKRPLCAECQRRGVIRVGTQRDHVVPRKERPDLALAEENIENLCDQCHGRKTRRGK